MDDIKVYILKTVSESLTKECENYLSKKSDNIDKYNFDLIEELNNLLGFINTGFGELIDKKIIYKN